MRRFAIFALVVGLLAGAGSPALGVTMDWVTVGDPGNSADGTGYGAVPYVYRIAQNEVTNAQYAEFLNAVAATDPNGLYSTDMAAASIARSGAPGSYSYSAVASRENMPVNFVAFRDALRFANWMHNGQPSGAQGSGTTEDGAYTITAAGIANNTITRNPGATFFLPSEDEWYKAAYYDADVFGYHAYPFADGFAGAACGAPPGATSHAANCNAVVNDRTIVGAYAGSPSAYGTFDQGGNVEEWNEAIVSGAYRGVRGGAFNAHPSFLAATSRDFHFSGVIGSSDPGINGTFRLGFRMASIPEPSSAALLALGLVLLVARRARRRR